MVGMIMKALAFLGGGIALSAQAAAPASAPARDYFNDKFEAERILDWGDRPVWSPDSKRIAFTVSEFQTGPAYEMDVATRKVRCLTCRWGASGLVARIYYLPDGSYLLLAPGSLETAEQTLNAKPQNIPKTFLYWMPADLSLPPQALGASAFGEIAIDYDHSPDGATRIGWGDMEGRFRLVMGDVVNDGKRAFLVNRTLLYDKAPNDPTSDISFTEAYDFIDGGKTLLFFSMEKKRLFNGMYRIDTATGQIEPMPTDGQHNETHSFPDTRFGLEESNRASDPSSPYRGISGHPKPLVAMLLKQRGEKNADEIAARYGGNGFDLYVVEWATGKRRRLTVTSDLGGEAHQSSPARDGQHIAFSVRAPRTGPFAGKPGLYLGTFSGRK